MIRDIVNLKNYFNDSINISHVFVRAGQVSEFVILHSSLMSAYFECRLVTRSIVYKSFLIAMGICVCACVCLFHYCLM